MGGPGQIITYQGLHACQPRYQNSGPIFIIIVVFLQMHTFMFFMLTNYHFCSINMNTVNFL